MTNAPQEPVDLTDPAISPHRLQELAQTHPEQWDEILAHPNMYPGLADWIRDRQAEQTAAQEFAAEPADQASAENFDDATKVFEPAELTETDAAADEPSDGETSEPESDPVHDEAEVAPTAADEAQDDADQAQPAWATPEPGGNQPSSEQESAEPAGGAWTQDSSQPTGTTGRAVQDEPILGWPGARPSSASQSQQQFQAPSSGYGHQPHGYQQPQHEAPYSYGQSYGQQQSYGQPYGQPFQAPRRQHSPIDLNSARTWGLFVAGGAAFMTLFGFFFGPSVSGFGVPSSSHLASGGWMILLLFLATVTLSILQLLKPSAWMRYFFIVVSFGAAFTMIGRTSALLGFFSMQNTSFSVVWMLFMSLVLLAGIMVYAAPKSADTAAQSSGAPQAQQAPQQFGYQQPPMQQPGYGQQPGNPPYGDYGQQPGGYPSGPQQ